MIAAPAGSPEPPAQSGGHSLDPMLLVGIAVILIVAKLGGELFERINQPAVLGELIAGIVLGNLFLIGFARAEPLKTDAVIAALAQIGVILLLFEVGLETKLAGDARSWLVFAPGRRRRSDRTVLSWLGRVGLLSSL